MTEPKSTETSPSILTPNLAALRTAEAALAHLSSALEGTQPTLLQSPPSKWASIRATLAPTPADAAADTNPPGPAPITTRL